MFPSNNNTLQQTPFSDPYSSLDENPSSFLFNFPPHLLDDDELLLGHLLHHHHRHPHPQPLPQPAVNPDDALPTDTAAAATTSLPAKDVQAVMSTEKPNNRVTSTKTRNKSTDHEATAAALDQETPTTGKKKRGTTARKPAASTTPRRRTVKKDRHSKIYTAQGPRDRRMRLSLPIARKFFDLQDLLGFDKASKTIEWLFTKSKSAIKELASSLPPKKINLSSGSASSAASDCTGMEITQAADARVDGSSSDHVTRPPEDHQQTSKNKSKNTTTRKLKACLRQQQPPHSTSHSHSQSHPSLTRASRDKARARARQRTMEKMQQLEMEKKKQHIGTIDQNQTNPSNEANNSTTTTSCCCCNNNNSKYANTNNSTSNILEKLGSSSATTPETTCEESPQDFNSSIDQISPPPPAEFNPSVASSNIVHHQQQQSLAHKMASVDIVVEQLVGAPSSIIYNYQLPGHPHDQERMGTDHGFLGFAGDSWMADSASIVSGNINPAAGYGALMTNNGRSNIISAVQEQKYPNSFFMATSGGSYNLQPQHHHHQFLQNYFSCNNSSLDANSNPGLL